MPDESLQQCMNKDYLLTYLLTYLNVGTMLQPFERMSQQRCNAVLR